MAAKASRAAASGAAYEEQRRKRVLENLKHLEVNSPVARSRYSSIHGPPSFFRTSTLHFFLSLLPFPAGSSIDLFLFLTLAPVFSAQDLGIAEMSKSLLQAARLQKLNKVLVARTPLAPRARAIRASVVMLC